MIELYLIRHAESEMNLRPYLVGGRSNDTPLTLMGREQARLLGERLHREGIKFEAVYASTARRAATTAEIAAEQIPLPLESIILCEDLLELDQGEWQGLPKAETHTPETIALISRNEWEFKSPKGESQREVENRMHTWFSREIAAAYTDARIAAFTHGIAIKCFLRGVLGSAPRMTRLIETENTSITRLKYDRGIWAISGVNDYSHLCKN